MLKHYISIFDNTYYIEKDGVIIFSITLNNNDAIEIQTPRQDVIGDVNDLYIIKSVDKS